MVFHFLIPLEFKPKRAGEPVRGVKNVPISAPKKWLRKAKSARLSTINGEEQFLFYSYARHFD